MTRPANELPPMQKIAAGGEELAVLRLGEGVPVVLLHGGPGLDHHLLLPLARRLEGVAELWLPDLPGHGRSRLAGRPLPELPMLQERTFRWLAALDPAPAVLGGHSLGAWLVREGLAQQRLEARGALLLSPPTPVAPNTAPARRRRRITRASGARRLRADLVELIEEETGEAPSKEFLEALSSASLHPPESYAPLLAQLRRRLAEPPARCDVAAALVLFGSEDHIAPPAQAEPLLQATPGAELVLVEGEGHFPFARRPESVAAPIEHFLRAHGLSDDGRGSRPTVP